MHTVRAKASTSNHLVTIVSTPLDVKTVIAPKVSGIAAAIGERKTSSRTISSTGSAISSPRSLAAIDSSCKARERVGNPDCVTFTGGCTSRSRTPSSSSTLSLTASAIGTWKSVRISARRGPGRSCPTCPLSQGERVVIRGFVACRARTTSGPWRSISSFGPCSRIANRAVSPKCSRSISFAVNEGVPSMSSDVGLSLSWTPKPRIARKATRTRPTARTRRGRRALMGTRGPPLSGSASSPCSSSHPRLVVWR